MFDIAHVRTRYYPVRFGGRVLQLEPLKLRTLNELVRLSRSVTQGDTGAYEDCTPLVARILSKNRYQVKISPKQVEDTLTIDQVSALLQGSLAWLKQERDSDPN